jgi:lysophospholipid acyltransferase (LPLAT)-like uncharacterized protein
VSQRAFERAGQAFAALFRVCLSTWRFVGLLPDGTVLAPSDYPFGPEILALSERDAIAITGIATKRDVAVLVARGRDGDFAAAALASLGYRIARGASGRDGLGALAALLELMGGASTPTGIVVDGPLGPLGRAKPGIIWCAAQTGRPVRALGAAARRTIVFRGNWSGVYLPLPFTRIAVACEAAQTIAPSASREERERAADELTIRLASARQRALDAIQSGVRPPAPGHPVAEVR